MFHNIFKWLGFFTIGIFSFLIFSSPGCVLGRTQRGSVGAEGQAIAQGLVHAVGGVSVNRGVLWADTDL